MGKPVRYDALQSLYERRGKVSALPLWEIYDSLLIEAPEALGRPFLWRYAELRELLMEGGHGDLGGRGSMKPGPDALGLDARRAARPLSSPTARPNAVRPARRASRRSARRPAHR